MSLRERCVTNGKKKRRPGVRTAATAKLKNACREI